MTTVLRLLRRPDGGTRALLRDDDVRLWLADLEAGGSLPVFRPADVDRLILFAEHAAVGAPAALRAPQAIHMLATLSLALVAVIDCPTSRSLFK